MNDPTLSRPLYTIECPECEGKGFIDTIEYTDLGEEILTNREDCCKCDGHGVIEDDSEPEFDKYEND